MKLSKYLLQIKSAPKSKFVATLCTDFEGDCMCHFLGLFFFLFFVENPLSKSFQHFLLRDMVLMSESMYFLSGPLGPGLMGSDPKGTEDR